MKIRERVPTHKRASGGACLPALTTLQKLFLIFTALLLFISIGFYALFSYIYRQNILQLVTGELESSTERMSEYLALIFTNVDNAVDILQSDSFLQQYALSSENTIDNLELMQFDTRLKSIASSNDMISAIDIYIDKNGMMFTSDYGATVHLDERTVAWCRSLMERNEEVYVTKAYRENIRYWIGRAQSQVTVVRPIYSYRTGEKKGIIAVSIDQAQLQRILTSSENFSSLVLDESGFALLSSLEEEAAPVLRDGRLLVDIPKGNGMYYQPLAGESYLFVCREVSYPGWRLVSFCSVDLLLSRGNKLRTYLLLLVLVNLLLVAATVLIILRSLFQRVRVLVGLMERVQKGDFNVSFVDNRGDEFSYIFESFNLMVENVNQLFNENYRLKLLQKDAQLKLLQAQINPHFIYNIFNNMNWLLQLQKYGELEELVDSVAVYYRRSLNDGKPFISVRGVMEKLTSYVNIQKIRFRNRFTCVFQVQQELMDGYMLNHILQPLLENAICHGVEPSDTQCHIVVRGCMQGEDMQFTVEDDGVGIAPERLADIRRALAESAAQGADYFALVNVNERIKICYGESYGLQIDSQETQGTIVQVKIPRRNAEGNHV